MNRGLIRDFFRVERPVNLLVVIILVGLNYSTSVAQTQTSSKSRVHRAMIQGIWWSPEMAQSAAFQVSDSTFYYPDNFLERKYDIKGDSLFVHFDDGSILPSIIVKLTADSLVLTTHGMVQLYTRKEPAR